VQPVEDASADSSVDSEVVADELQSRIVAFVRAFGLHKPDETPCGAPIPVSEAHALAVLTEHGPLAQTDLARHLGLTKSTVSRLVDQLAGRGWVQRRPGADARRRLVGLTEQGATVAADVAGRRSARLARLLERIPEAERPAVLAALDALVEAARAD
jgi:DNA-binding MarR family transcriptional regulator